MATIKEVAQLAEVSVATVSRVLNDTGFVSEPLRERVLKAAKDLNYRPSRVAKSLRHQKTNTIGVLVPQLDMPFFSTLTFAIQRTLADSEYYTLVASTMEDSVQELAYVEMMIESRVDGVIIVPTGHALSNIERLVEANVPMVLVDRDFNALPQIDRVLCDNRTGAYHAVKHLLQRGHRHIALVGGPTYSTPIQRRVQGYEDALREFSVKRPDHWFILENRPPFEMGYEGAKRLFTQQPYPTAIFALGDITAVGVLHAARELGITMPDDVSLVGFDDIPLAAYCLPPLTTVAQPVYDMGRVAAQRLIKRIENAVDDTQRTILDAVLVERESTMALT